VINPNRKRPHRRRSTIALALLATAFLLALPAIDGVAIASASPQAAAKQGSHSRSRWRKWIRRHHWRHQQGDEAAQVIIPPPPPGGGVTVLPPSEFPQSPLPPESAPPEVVGPPAPPLEELPPEPPLVEEPAPPAEEPPVEEPAPPAEEPPVEEPAPPAEEPPVEEPAPPVEEPPVEEPAPPAEEPPVEEPAPPEEVGGLIFLGDQIRDFHLNQSAPGAITEVPDPLNSNRTVMQMTVDNSDVFPITPTADPRAQLLSPDIFEPGDEYWWNSEFLLPADFPASTPGWVTLLEGPYGEPFDGTPPWHIEVNGNHLRWSRNGTYNWDIPWEAPLIRGSWVHVLVHGKFAREGWIEMWINGQPITFFSGGTSNPNGEAATRRLNMATEDSSNDARTNFAVIQSYRELGIFQTLTIFQGPMRIGETRASVGG
jgi:hypothetical protein